MKKAIEYNDDLLRRHPRDAFLNWKCFEYNARILFYVKDEVLYPKIENVPWHHISPLNYEVEELENYWFGLEQLPNAAISASDLRLLSGEHELPSDIIYYFYMMSW